jgi:hypothetical protein
MHISANDDQSNTNYLLNMGKNLANLEKIVVLLIDEIYVSNRLDYPDKSILGTAYNNNDSAKTVLSYMITSAFGSFCEIVKFLPVNKIKGDEMAPITKNIIDYVQNCGSAVLCVISDNHAINRTMFTKLSTNSKSLPNPKCEEDTSFLNYDFVHIFKNIKNLS